MTDTKSTASLGSRLRRLRLSRQLTQADLAQRARVSLVYVRKLERATNKGTTTAMAG